MPMIDVPRQAEMLANRVKKTHRHLAARFDKRGVGAYRLYDRDIPEIRAVVDWYEGHLVMAEYARTQTDAIGDWLEQMAAAVGAALAIPSEKIHLRTRRTRPADGERYTRQGQGGARLEVREQGLKFLVNLDDYLDTGLFLDHRETRARVRAEAQGARFLNLYAYTGSFTVYAADGGAIESDSVDASGPYLDWARDNLTLNGLASPAHRLAKQDARAFLYAAARAGKKYTLCVLDPPSFSDRGGGRAALDVQRDHRALVEETLAVLQKGGVLYFSTNHQRFEPRLGGLAGAAECREITAETIPEDFRNKTVHRAWRIVR
jgi:23S rRNA G2069 N7-methylase RlmK/C1962 C5-methylase RlmI